MIGWLGTLTVTANGAWESYHVSDPLKDFFCLTTITNLAKNFPTGGNYRKGSALFM